MKYDDDNENNNDNDGKADLDENRTPSSRARRPQNRSRNVLAKKFRGLFLNRRSMPVRVVPGGRDDRVGKHLDVLYRVSEERAKIRDGLEALETTEGLIGKVTRVQDEGEALKPFVFVHAKNGNWEVLHDPRN